ncbi:hypothetical protein [Halobaculum sp. MBLA0143]|uniref:hypothetical protein n=1 Tax=Halobaculum sp. MBLA0143 TaxID=3079933 RepID=UPI0035241621
MLLERLTWLIVGAGASLVLAGYRRLVSPSTDGSDDGSLARTLFRTAARVVAYGLAAGTLLYGVERGLPLWVAAGFVAVEAVGLLADRRA